MKSVLPGAVLGVLGGGQLGRMFVQTAQRMGYRVIVYAPEEECPAAQVAWDSIEADYEDEGALREFAGRVTAVTLEFENIPVTALELLGQFVPVRPGPLALGVTQNRGKEKQFLARHGFPHALTVPLSSASEFDRALELTGTPAILKSAGFGYDGKGQVVVRGDDDREAALAQLADGPTVLERMVEFRREFSVIVCRFPNGSVVSYEPIENEHKRQILDLSLAPAATGAGTAAAARELAREIAVSLELEGVAAVEFFETDGGELLVNEIAPRPHNSGHLTIEACASSQFEQQLRALCALPPGDTSLIAPAAMVNLLGELWSGAQPSWPALLLHPGVYLHLYGKADARPGRKMGHLTALADTAGLSVGKVRAARDALAGIG